MTYYELLGVNRNASEKEVVYGLILYLEEKIQWNFISALLYFFWSVSFYEMNS
jgi:hypothetical protein